MRILEKKNNLLNNGLVFSSSNNKTKILNLIEDLPTDTYSVNAIEDGSSGVFKLKLLIDASGLTAQEIDTLMITGNYLDKLGYDLGDSDTISFTLKASDTYSQSLSDPTTDEYTGNLTGTIVDIGTAQGTKVSYKENIMMIVSSQDYAYNFYELEISFDVSSEAGNGTLEVHLSNIFLGKSTELENNGIEQKTFVYALIDNSKTSTNNNGQRFTTEYSTQKRMSGTINMVNSDEMDYLLNVFRDNGTHTPVGLILDEDETMSIANSLEKFSGLFYINKDFSFKMIAPDYFSMAFDVSQAV